MLRGDGLIVPRLAIVAGEHFPHAPACRRQVARLIGHRERQRQCIGEVRRSVQPLFDLVLLLEQKLAVEKRVGGQISSATNSGKFGSAPPRFTRSAIVIHISARRLRNRGSSAGSLKITGSTRPRAGCRSPPDASDRNRRPASGRRPTRRFVASSEPSRLVASGAVTLPEKSARRCSRP
jgi:hypothetical protein